MHHLADQVGEVHPRKCLLEVAEVAVCQYQRPCARGFLCHDVENLPGLVEKASLLSLAAAVVHHQPNELRPAESFDHAALPLVELWWLLRVLHVAVVTRLAVLTVPGDEVDARAPAHLGVPKTTLTGQWEELCHATRNLKALEITPPWAVCKLHLRAHLALGAGACCGGRPILELPGQVRGLLGESAHIGAHGFLLAGSLFAEADAAHAPWWRAACAGPARTARHVLELLLHVDESIPIFEFHGHGGDWPTFLSGQDAPNCEVFVGQKAAATSAHPHESSK